MNYLVLPSNPTFVRLLSYTLLLLVTIIAFTALFVNFISWSMTAAHFRLYIFTILYHICYYLVHKYVKVSHDS